MKKITNEDRIDDLLSAGSLAEAESLYERASLVMKLRRKMQGMEPAKRTRKPRTATGTPPLLAGELAK